MPLKNILPREKWRLLLTGGDAGPMVSPLCDDWSLDIPYYWPYDQPDPFPPGHKRHMLSQQMAMAEICGWDGMFLAGFDFSSFNRDIQTTSKTWKSENRTMVETRIETPYGQLSNVLARSHNTSHTDKEWLETRDDYHKAIWVAKQWMDYDEDVAIEQGMELVEAISDKGILGTWVDSPIVFFCNIPQVFYHSADWPDEFEELHELTVALTMKRLDTLKKAGLDYIFHVVWGTEWSSPGFFRQWVMGPSGDIINKWRGLGGYTLWHTCGHASRFIEEGYYNQLMPDILESLSERPEGDIISLRWARERLDRGIVTKGNIRMDVLLQGTETDIRAEVNRVRSETKGYRHIVGLSDDMLRNTPLANALAFADEAKK